MCAAVTWVTVHVTILHVIYWRGYFTVDIPSSMRIVIIIVAIIVIVVMTMRQTGELLMWGG